MRPAPFTPSRRHLALILLLLALAAVLMLGRKAPDEGAADAVALRPAAPAASASVLSAWDLLARANREAGDAAAALPMPTVGDAFAMQRFEAAWCAGPGAQLAADLAQQDEGSAAAAVVQSQSRSLNRLSELLMQGLPQRLRQRGDARSWALADWLDGADPAARQRLLLAARSSSDAMVVALARNRACSDERCRRELAERWALLEPGNLQALLQAQRGLPDQAQLQRLAASNWSRDYRVEAFRLIGEIEPVAQGPLLAGMQTIALLGRATAWDAPDYSGLLQACGSAAPGGPRAGPCAAIAERLWNDEEGSLSDAAIALRLIAAQPSLHGAWRTRAQLHEASTEWLTQRSLGNSIQHVLRVSACAVSPAEDRLLRQSLLGGERQRLLQEMLTADADLAALAAQYRQTRQQGALDAPAPR